MKKILFLTLFLLAFSGRLFRLGPNIEFVTGAMILATIFLGRKYSIFLVLAVMISTDLILGNSHIFLFTWTGFLIPALVLKLKKPLMGILAGLGSNAFVFLWTNFGVWALDSWGMYEKNLGGLISCYINGLPFLKNQIVSTLVVIPVGFIVIKVITKYVKAEDKSYLKAF